MSLVQTAVASSQTILLPRAEYDALQAQVQSLKAQLDWFKRQLFGVRSEKRLQIDPAIQADLLAALGDALPAPAIPETRKISYERRKSRSDNTVTDTGLRFDDSVPVQTIVLSSPQLADVPEDEQVLITQKVTYRLAQRPGSYVVLKYVRRVIKRKDTHELVTPPAPLNVLDKSIADVSFLAGMLVDKFLYHLPLYRQHQRLRQCGIDIARPTLTRLSSRAIDLLEPIVDA
jgi:transposase